MTNLSAAQNYITRLSGSSCKLFDQVQDTVLKSTNFAEARTYFYNTYNENMAKMVNWDHVSNTDFDNTCEYIFFAQYDPKLNENLNITVTDFDRAYCGAWLNGWIYQECLALDIQWQLVSYEYLTQLLEFSKYLNG